MCFLFLVSANNFNYKHDLTRYTVAYIKDGLTEGYFAFHDAKDRKFIRKNETFSRRHITSCVVKIKKKNTDLCADG